MTSGAAGTDLAGFTIRRAVPDDIDSLTDLRVRLLRESGLLEGDAAALESAIRAYLTENLESGQFMAWVAESGGDIIGTSGLVFMQKPPTQANLSGRQAYIMNMYTKPDARGQSIATRLLETVLAHIRECGVTRISLHATESGAQIYRKFGFKHADSEMILDIERAS